MACKDGKCKQRKNNKLAEQRKAMLEMRKSALAKKLERKRTKNEGS